MGYAILSLLSDPVGERTWWRRVEPLVTNYIWQQHGGALLAMGDRMVVISSGAQEFTDLPDAAMRSGMYLQGGVWKPLVPGLGSRSEERRVGKECRSRWSPYH